MSKTFLLQMSKTFLFTLSVRAVVTVFVLFFSEGP